MGLLRSSVSMCYELLSQLPSYRGLLLPIVPVAASHLVCMVIGGDRPLVRVDHRKVLRILESLLTVISVENQFISP